MEYHEWITFVNEICRKSAQIKDYFGDTSSKTWKYVNQKLVFK